MTAPKVSFEFFPPQSLDASFRLWETVQALAPLKPEFVSVTYGAGGTTRKLTHEAVETIHNHYKMPVAAHLTCVDATCAETLKIAHSYADVGVTQLVALRGDPPKDSKGFAAHPGGFESSVDLIAALADTGRFKLHVGAYPDRHPEAQSDDADVEYLKRKIDAGASSAITQFFFDVDSFFRFRDRCAKAGINAPIVPGILPIDKWSKVAKFASGCGAVIPSWLDEAFTRAERDGREDLLATAICSEMCSDLIENGVENLHFYTLNKPHLTRNVCHALGILPDVSLQKVA